MLPCLCCWSALVGRLSILECDVWGFLLLFALFLFPLLRLFVAAQIRARAPEDKTGEEPKIIHIRSNGTKRAFVDVLQSDAMVRNA